MELFFGKFVLMYLLLPLIGLLLGIVMFFIAKKNNLLQNKKAIIYFLLTCVVLAIPALLGFIDYAFMPAGYIFLSAVYLLLGYFNLQLLILFIPGINKKLYFIEFLCQLIPMFIGAALFSVLFNLCNELQYGIWASTSLLSFLLPSLFLKAYNTYIDIPLEIYTSWSYSTEAGEMEMEHFDSSRVIVVELELFKQVEDLKPLNIKAKAAENAPFGVWFKMFIDHYNIKSPLQPIACSDSDHSYAWMFYVNAFPFRKKHIDPGLSFAENKIKEKNVIIAKRIQRTGQATNE